MICVYGMPEDTIYADHKHRLITVLLEGTATDAGVIALFNRLRAMPEFAEGYSVLFDSSKTEESKMTSDGVFNLVQSFPKDENRFAIVVNSPYNLGIAQVYEACANWKVNRVAVFTRIQTALEALDISD
jgi:hypothetical protein